MFAPMRFDQYAASYHASAKRRFWIATISVALFALLLAVWFAFSLIRSNKSDGAKLLLAITIWLGIFGPFSLIFLFVGLGLRRQLRRLQRVTTMAPQEVLWIYGEVMDNLTWSKSFVILCMHDGYKLRMSDAPGGHQATLAMVHAYFPHALFGPGQWQEHAYAQARAAWRAHAAQWPRA